MRIGGILVRIKAAILVTVAISCGDHACVAGEGLVFGLILNLRHVSEADARYEVEVVAEANRWLLECSIKSGASAACEAIEYTFSDEALILRELVNTKDAEWTIFVHRERSGEKVCGTGPETAGLTVRRDGVTILERSFGLTYEVIHSCGCDYMGYSEEIELAP